MSASYIPEKTCVVCTSMTVSKPLKLEHIHNGITYYRGESKAMLNIDDRKISQTFMCKNPQKFWGGLGAMLMGIAVGIVIGAAIIGTAGAAAVVIAAIAVTTVAAGAGMAVTGIVLAANDCDVIQTTKWKLFHPKVNFDGKNALLQKSFLSCSKGGIVSIVPDPVKAQNFASTYADNNNAEVLKHFASQGIEGFITGVTFLGSPIAAVVGGGMGIYFYQKNESEGLDKQSKALTDLSLEKSSFGDDVNSQLAQEKYNQPTGIGIGVGEGANEVVKKQMVPINQTLNTEIAHLGTQATALEAEAAALSARGLSTQAAEVSARAANARLAQDIASRSYRMPWKISGWRGLNLAPNIKSFTVGVGVGIAGAVVNFGIEEVVNGMENENFRDVLSNLDKIVRSNTAGQQGVNIISSNN